MLCFQQVLDHETYVMNLTEANLSSKKQPQWKLEYRAKVRLCLSCVAKSCVLGFISNFGLVGGLQYD